MAVPSTVTRSVAGSMRRPGSVTTSPLTVDPALRDEVLGDAAGGDAGGGHDLLQALALGLLGVSRRLSGSSSSNPSEPSASSGEIVRQLVDRVDAELA